jgi:hypothetical protein
MLKKAHAPNPFIFSVCQTLPVIAECATYGYLLCQQYTGSCVVCLWIQQFSKLQKGRSETFHSLITMSNGQDVIK